MKDKAVLICQECHSRNYEIRRSTKGDSRFTITKYCKKCMKHTLHKEGK
ncbi:MAG: 50S ribosomal protein L33 [Candidatus Izemoplasmatales bacterium]|nr:50S ribosomal protein L33 [Acholeplasmataceae bacterium]